MIHEMLNIAVAFLFAGLSLGTKEYEFSLLFASTGAVQILSVVMGGVAA